jgi:TrkA domain protein
VHVQVEQVDLPGVGVRHDLTTESGRRIGVVAHRSGQHDLAIYDRDDPDACEVSVPLTEDEAGALADVLGASVMLSRLTALSRQAAGLVTEQITVSATSPHAGRPLGDTQARTRTGASIVAVVRDGEVIPSPGPEQVLAGGDVVVVVGTRAGVEGVARIFAGDWA